MDINKYLNNKDIQLSNDDINIEKLEKDIRKGYVPASEIDTAKEEVLKNSTSKYTELETKYSDLERNYAALEGRNTELSNLNSGLKLKVEMVSQGFKTEQFEEIAQLRSTLFSEEPDDAKAVAGIKEKFKDTYFPKPEEPTVNIPNEPKFTVPQTPEKPEIRITRNTKIKDILK